MDDRGTHIYPLFSSHGGIHLQLINRKMWGKVVVDKTRALNCNGLQFYLRIQHFLPELIIWMPNSNRFILQHDQTLYYTLSNTGGFCIKVRRRFPNPPHGGFRFVMTGYPQSSSSDRTMGFPRKKTHHFGSPMTIRNSLRTWFNGHGNFVASDSLINMVVFFPYILLNVFFHFGVPHEKFHEQIHEKTTIKPP